MLRYILYLGGETCNVKKKLKTAGNLAFSQTGSQFVYACAVDLRMSVRKGEEKPSMETTVRGATFACEWLFLSVHDMMTSLTRSNISLP